MVFVSDITERQETEGALKRSEAILEAVRFAGERFLVAPDWQDEMDAILDRLGRATGVSRVYVFQNRVGSRGEILTSQRFEWCMPGILSQLDNPDLQSFPLRTGGFGRWEATLSRGDVIHGQVRAFPESEQQVLAIQDIQSIVVVPIFAGDCWWGFIGFDECAHEREWSPPERDALKTAANLLGAAIERRRAEQALQASEERYRSLVEQAQDGIVVLQENKIKYVNSYATELCGYTAQELLGTPFNVYLPADQLPDLLGRYQRRMNGEAVPSIYPSSIQHKDGSRIEVEFNASLTTYEGQPADQIIIRDIRDRIQAQRELQESQRLLSLVIDHVPAQIAYVDAGQRYRFVNWHYEQNYGIPRSQFEGRHVQEVLGHQGYAAAEPYIAAALAGDAVSYEELFAYPDLGPRWLAIDYVPDRDRGGEVRGFVAMLTDVTEDKQIEVELTRSKERLEEAQAIAQIGDWEYDILAGKTTWSDEMYRIFGVDREHYVPTDKSDREFCHPEDRPALREAFEHFFASGQDLDTDYRIVTPQGEFRACRIRGRLIRDDEGTLRFAIGTIEDITARKRAEQQVQEYQRRLQALAAQLTLTEERERRRMARELHDEVGQTLSFARMRLASAREARSETKREIILDQVSQALRQAIGEIRDLVFDLSSPLMHELGLASALKEWLEDQVGKKQGLQTEFVHDGQRLPLDDDVMAILFRSARELLTNVVKHARAQRVVVRLERKGEEVRIVVQDDGVGFDVQALPGAVDREGGFGLFSIQERMSDLGGALEITSAPGQGCTAVLTAPLLVD